MTDWGLPLSQYSQQCQACFAPQSGSGLDIVENTEQGRQANQYRYPRPERRYSVFRNRGTVAPEYSLGVSSLSRTTYAAHHNNLAHKTSFSFSETTSINLYYKAESSSIALSKKIIPSRCSSSWQKHFAISSSPSTIISSPYSLSA